MASPGKKPGRRKKVPATFKKRKHIKRNVIIIVILLLVAFRIFLPYLVLRYVNKTLAELDQYYGHVEDIDLRLYRGAYVIKDMKIVKVDKESKARDTFPFFKTPKIDLSVEWKAIFKGRLVGQIKIKSPVLNFVKGKHEGEDIKKDTADFRELVDDLMPLTVNRFEVSDGQLHYIDFHSQPKIDLFIKDMEIVGSNLSNVNDSDKLLPARMVASGNSYGGQLKLNMNFDALNKHPTFDMNAQFTNINLVELNDVLQAYGNFDVKKGKIGLYTEFAAKNGEFGGYVKPFVKDLDVVQWTKEEGDFKQILWETIVGSGLELLKNQPEDQLSTKVEIKGRFEDPYINKWRAVSYILRNAFVETLKPSIDNSINIQHLEEDKKKTLLEKVFGKRDKKKQQEDKKKKK